jgi:hypothetical protein
MPQPVLSIPNALEWIKSLEMNPAILSDDGMTQNILAEIFSNTLGVALGLHQNQKYQLIRPIENLLMQSPSLALGFLRYPESLFVVVYDVLVLQPPALTPQMQTPWPKQTSVTYRQPSTFHRCCSV